MLPPTFSADSSSPGDQEAIARLVSDLERYAPSVPLPESLRENLLARIDSEPPRVETDATGAITAINPAFFSLCGYTFAELQGQKPGALLQGPDSSSDAKAALREAIRRAEPCEVSIVNYHKDGHPYRVHISMEPVRDSLGTLTGFRAAEREIPL